MHSAGSFAPWRVTARCPIVDPDLTPEWSDIPVLVAASVLTFADLCAFLLHTFWGCAEFAAATHSALEDRISGRLFRGAHGHGG